MSGYFWVVLGLLVVTITKYLTSVRLRGLAVKMQREQDDANGLRDVLVEASQKETVLKNETARLKTKLTALRNVVGNIERLLQRYNRGES